MKQFVNINDLQLEQVNVVQAAIENTIGADANTTNPVQLKFNVGLKQGLNIELNKAIIKVFIQVEVLNIDGTTVNISAKFDIDFLFRISSLKEYVNIEGEGGQIEASLSGILFSTAYSTARGIIYTRCLGTVLGNVMIPIIPVQDLFHIAEKNFPS